MKAIENEIRKGYYDNSNLCGECTGAGCKRCWNISDLLRIGTTRFPLALEINGCTPPMIAKSYRNINFRIEAKKIRLTK